MASLELPSKSTFIKERIFPANEDDAFNDNNCAFCRESYSDDHPPVRVLPCNHVFGKDCLSEVINKSPVGHRCMVCCTPLFRPPLVSVSDLLAIIIILPFAMAFLPFICIYEALGAIGLFIDFWALTWLAQIRRGKWGIAIARLIFSPSHEVDVALTSFWVAQSAFELATCMVDPVLNALLTRGNIVQDYSLSPSPFDFVAAIGSAYCVWATLGIRIEQARDRVLLVVALGAVIFLDYTPCGSWLYGYLHAWVPEFLETWLVGWYGCVAGYMARWVPGILQWWANGWLHGWIPWLLGWV